MEGNNAPQAPASFIRRMGAFVIDTVVVSGISFGLVMLAVAPDATAYPDEPGVRREPWDTISTIVVLLAPVYWFAYQWVSNAFGVSIGKRLMSLRVVLHPGNGIRSTLSTPPGVWRGLSRSLGQVIGIIALGLGFWWALWDQERRCWHDKLAGTQVVPRLTYELGLYGLRDYRRYDYQWEYRPWLLASGCLLILLIIILLFAAALEWFKPAIGVPLFISYLVVVFISNVVSSRLHSYVELTQNVVTIRTPSKREVRYRDINRITLNWEGKVELRLEDSLHGKRPERFITIAPLKDAQNFALELERRVKAVRDDQLLVFR